MVRETRLLFLWYSDIISCNRPEMSCLVEFNVLMQIQKYLWEYVPFAFNCCILNAALKLPTMYLELLVLLFVASMEVEK